MTDSEKIKDSKANAAVIIKSDASAKIDVKATLPGPVFSTTNAPTVPLAFSALSVSFV